MIKFFSWLRCEGNVTPRKAPSLFSRLRMPPVAITSALRYLNRSSLHEPFLSSDFSMLIVRKVGLFHLSNTINFFIVMICFCLKDEYPSIILAFFFTKERIVASTSLIVGESDKSGKKWLYSVAALYLLLRVENISEGMKYPG